MAYCNRVSVKMASENSSENEFETLHGLVRPYLLEPTAKPGAEWIKLPQHHAKLVLDSFDNVNQRDSLHGKEITDNTKGSMFCTCL